MLVWNLCNPSLSFSISNKSVKVLLLRVVYGRNKKGKIFGHFLFLLYTAYHLHQASFLFYELGTLGKQVPSRVTILLLAILWIFSTLLYHYLVLDDLHFIGFAITLGTVYFAAWYICLFFTVYLFIILWSLLFFWYTIYDIAASISS